MLAAVTGILFSPEALRADVSELHGCGPSLSTENVHPAPSASQHLAGQGLVFVPKQVEAWFKIERSVQSCQPKPVSADGQPDRPNLGRR